MKLKVLLAEDERVLRECYAWGLEDEGYQVTALSNSDELAANADDADVLVVDAALPNREIMEGIVTIGELLRKGKVRANVPIIFISIWPQEEPVVKAKLEKQEIRADRYIWLLKPFEVELLAKRIREEYDARNDK